MYEQFFGLVDAPFRLTPDPRYLFLSRKHAEALAHLRLSLTESSGFVCITGDVGTGKTTLLRAFLANLGPEVSTAYIFNPAVTATELLRRVNREFGVPAESTSQVELVDVLNAHLLAQRKEDRLAIVVVDEAQALSVELLEQLRLLSNLETTTEKLLRIVLVGQPQLRGLLLHPELTQLNQRITLRWHMGPLSRRETVAYVRHRLGVASKWKSTRLFTRPALWLLHRRARGVPRLINMIAHRAMLAAFTARQRTVSFRAVRRAYREIEAVPLPAAPSRARRVTTWAATATAVSVALVTLGLPQPGWWPALPVPQVREQPPAAPPPVAPAEAAPRVGAEDGVRLLESRLATLARDTSARAAAEAVLAAWHVAPLGSDTAELPGDLERIAWARGLEVLPLTGNLSMLFLFDLPAVLELRLPDTAEARYAALTGIDEGSVVLHLEGTRVVVDAQSLDRFWFGRAHVLWRDFESLGQTFGQEAQGPRVARLQTLLARAGAYQGEASGQYDAATAAAVLDFQRSHLLVVDGLVGRLTRIVLYAASGGYPRPTLLAPTGGVS